jgi:alpha-mannosidase
MAETTVAHPRPGTHGDRASSVETLFIAPHSHTDIGYTDWQDACFRQLESFVPQVLDRVEETADFPAEARLRWVFEVTGPLLPWLRSASPAQRERLRHWNACGAIEVAAMQYNLTPLLGTEQMVRSLYPVRVLREEYGLQVRTGMQDDVNGVSWRFAELLAEIGVDFLTVAHNPIRGRAPSPLPSGFWWEDATGGRLLCWNGFHYSFGRTIARLGDWELAGGAVAHVLARLEAQGYASDILYGEATHPARVDNGPPDRRLSEFVRRWNAEGCVPRIELTTPGRFGDVLRERVADELPTWRGDWTDTWCDGAASSAAETGVNRATHELLAVTEAVQAWAHARGVRSGALDRMPAIYEQSTLYDEHTWGAFSSVTAPSALFTAAQWNRKASYAYGAAMDTHEALAAAVEGFAGLIADPPPEGQFDAGDLSPEKVVPSSGTSEWLVINTLPFAREAEIEEPEPRAGSAPVAMLSMFVPRGAGHSGLPVEDPRRGRFALPALGYVFVDPQASPPPDDLRIAPRTVENARYRLAVDAETGGLETLYDKHLGRDFAASLGPFRTGQYVHEIVDAPEGRAALYELEITRDGYGHWHRDPALQREGPRRVRIGHPRIEGGRACIDVDIDARGVRSARCRYVLESHGDAVGVDWLLDKERHEAPEAVYIVFPFALGDASFRLDLNGIPATPDADQLPGTARDWFPVRRWADVSDGRHGVTIAPLDAPLVQLGGFTTGKLADTLRPESPALVSFALHNHWMVNFRAAQEGPIELRYRLTTHAGPCDDAAASRFGAGAATPPIVLREHARRPGEPRSGHFVELADDAVEVHAKVAEDRDGVVLRIADVSGRPRTAALRFGAPAPRTVHETSQLEEDGRQLPLVDGCVAVPVRPHGLTAVRLRF